MDMSVIIMRGIPGSGKTTWAKEFAKGSSYVQIYSADDYFVCGQTYNFDPKLLPQAHNQCLSRFLTWTNSSRANGVLIIDNTNTSAWEVSPYYRMCEICEIPVEIIRVVCDPITAAKRNTHNVPVKLILDMHQRMMEERLPPWWKEKVVFSE